LEGGEIEKEEEFMWRGKERKMREAGIDGTMMMMTFINIICSPCRGASGVPDG